VYKCVESLPLFGGLFPTCFVGRFGDVDDLAVLSETLLTVVNGSFKVSFTY
jgi:hypothetical protein